MKLEVNYVSGKIVEVSTSKLSSGLLDANEANDLAYNLLVVATQLMELKQEQSE